MKGVIKGPQAGGLAATAAGLVPAARGFRAVPILLFASLGALVCQYLFHLFVSRGLGPEDYGIFTALFALLAIAGMPAQVVQTIVAGHVSRFSALGESALAAASFRSLAGKVVLLSALVLFAYLLASHQIARWLHIGSVSPVMALGLAIFLLLIGPVALGGLQGWQRFGHLGLNIFLTGALRLGVGMGLVSLGLGVTGAIAATAIAAFVTLLVAAAPLALVLAAQPGCPKVGYQGIDGDDLFIFLALLGLAVLTSVDVLFVKHFFGPAEAGYYGAAALLARAGLHGAAAVAAVAFPKACEEGVGKAAPEPVLRPSLFIASSLSAGSVLLLFVMPSFLVGALFGPDYAPAATIAGPLALAVAPMALAYVLVFYNLGRRSRRFVYPLMACAGLEIFLLAFFHRSLMQVVTVVGMVGLLAFTVNLYFALRAGRQRGRGFGRGPELAAASQGAPELWGPGLGDKKGR